mgnify:CR=1 FL=1
MKQHDIILRELRANPGKWYYPPDFMQNNHCFVGYEASARLSELAKKYPDEIESDRRGKYIYRRVRPEYARTEPMVQVADEVTVTPQDDRIYAQYLGRDYSLTPNEHYFIRVSKIAFGQPIQVKLEGVTGKVFLYKDLAAFRSNWKVIEGGK